MNLTIMTLDWLGGIMAYEVAPASPFLCLSPTALITTTPPPSPHPPPPLQQASLAMISLDSQSCAMIHGFPTERLHCGGDRCSCSAHSSLPSLDQGKSLGSLMVQPNGVLTEPSL